MIKKIIPYILFIICFTDLFAINIYPIKLELSSVERGGKLIPKLDNKDLTNYFFKPGWAGNTDIYSFWKGFNKNNIKVYNLGNLNIIKAELFKNNFLLIYEQNGKIFVALADTNLSIKHIKEIHQNQQYYDYNKITLENVTKNIYSLLINDNLYSITFNNDNLELQFISANVSTHPVFHRNQLYFIKKNMFYQELRAYNKNHDTIVLSLQLPNYSKLIKLNDELILLSGSKYSDNSWVFFINNKNIQHKINVQTSPEKLLFYTKNGKSYCYYLNFENFNYYLVVSEIVNYSLKNIDQIEIPKSIIELKKMQIIGDEIFLLFKNSLLIFDYVGNIKSLVFLPFTEYFPLQPQMFLVNDLLYISDFSNSIVLKKVKNNYWWFFYYYEKLGNYTFVILFVIIILIIYRKYLKQKLVTRALLDLPSSGVVLIVDKNGKLTKINEPARNLLRITKDVPLKRLFTFYCDEKTENLKNIVEKALLLKEGFREEVKIIEEDKFTEWVFTIYPLNNLFGFISSFIITGINITEELERKRIYNWAQLAHDMQTNLSTIKLNAEQLKCSDDEDMSRKKKILIQTNILIHKVRDIVTVGRSDELNLMVVNSSELCKAVKEEFDETLFPNVKLNFDCQNFEFKCDKAKILRALRNTIENGIKSIKMDKGKIDISIWHDLNYVYFSVKDNGVGMNEKQLKNIKRPFYTTNKKDGGSGIGTMIIQNVVEQHGGELKFSSKIDEGTEVIIKIPYINERDR